ncbi:protein phosphatase CheZ, partial [Caenispirillum bisanense]|uniref:protein phosphatase CheZ n=1 Tax=Caenispirillum bisanense TaxID=414052 RepID=UPI0031E241DC
MSDHSDVLILKRELLGLFQHIQKIRKEIAAIRRPGTNPDQDHFSKMSDELDAIVEATESATETIMENAEKLEDVVNAVRPMVNNAEGRALLDSVQDRTGAIFEACAFQDITGQRITKVVNSLRFVEERVNALISIWGQDQIAHESLEDGSNEDEYKKYLNGPQLKGHGVSQADVDAMFGPSGSGAAAAPAAPAAAPAAPAPAAARPAAAPA